MHDDVTTLFNLASDAFKEGRFADVERACNDALARNPNDLRAMVLRAVSTARASQNDLAIARFEEVLKFQPDDFFSLGWLANLLREAGRPSKAVIYAERARRFRPTDPEAAHSLGLCYCAVKRFADAAQCFQRAIAIDPRRAETFYDLALVQEWLGRTADSAESLRRGLALKPDLGALLKLGQFALSAGNSDEAIQVAETAIDLEPQLVAGHLLLAKALSSANRHREASDSIANAEQLSPDSGEVHSNLASLHQANGRFDLAEAAFRRSIELQPNQGRAYYGVLSCRKVKEEDRPFVEAISKLLSQEGFDPMERAYLHYALGKALDNLGSYHEAIRAYDAANAIVQKVHPRVRNFDRKEFQYQIEARRSMFSRDSFSRRPESTFHPLNPILIVGMPRTGTTLVEQILSSHPSIGAGGERGYWSLRETTVADFAKRKINLQALGAAATEYCEMLSNLAPGMAYVTDKNPANLLAVGLIHLALPQARIICTHRHPVDTALSIYMTPVANPPPFACDRDNIVLAHGACMRLRAHWRDVLPQDRFMEVDYEKLVTDREWVTREIVGFCGLEWSDACLHPEANARTIMTPSFWQARQAVYTTSIDRWKNYEPWLGSFRKLL